MGINKLMGGKRKMRDVCETNPDTGEVTCVRHRVNPMVPKKRLLVLQCLSMRTVLQ